MSRKSFIFVVILLMLIILPAFTEENGSVIGTFGIGYTGMTSISHFTAIAFDIDLIANNGFAVLFGNIANFAIGEGVYNLSYAGIGYRYLGEKGDFGLSFIIVPSEMLQDILVGAKVNTGYWFKNNTGLSLSIMAGYGFYSEVFAFSIRPGISIKIK